MGHQLQPESRTSVREFKSCLNIIFGGWHTVMGAIPLFFCSVSCEIVGKTSKYRRFRARAVEFRVFSLSSVVLPSLRAKAAQTRFLEIKRISACVFPCCVRKRRNKHDGTRLFRPKKKRYGWMVTACFLPAASRTSRARSVCRLHRLPCCRSSLQGTSTA